jgi:hypothetical protein
MNLTGARLALRLQRFEVWASVIAVAAVSITALIVRMRLESVAAPVPCLTPWLFPDVAIDAATCDPLAMAFLAIKNDEAALVLNAISIVPLVVGVMLGVGLVGREIEGGTAPTVWALAGSRRRWLLGRLIPVLGVLLVLLAVAGVASELLATATRPWLEGRPSFEDAAPHGSALIARGLAAFGVALAVGSWSGRSLPTAIISALLALFLWAGGFALLGAWTEAAAHDISVPSWFNGEYDGGKFTGFFYVLPNGERIDPRFTDVSSLAPAGVDAEEWLETTVRKVAVGVVSQDYPGWLITSLAVFGGLGVLAIGLTFVIVERRRPF